MGGQTEQQQRTAEEWLDHFCQNFLACDVDDEAQQLVAFSNTQEALAALGLSYAALAEEIEKVGGFADLIPPDNQYYADRESRAKRIMALFKGLANNDREDLPFVALKKLRSHCAEYGITFQAILSKLDQGSPDPQADHAADEEVQKVIQELMDALEKTTNALDLSEQNVEKLQQAFLFQSDWKKILSDRVNHIAELYKPSEKSSIFVRLGVRLGWWADPNQFNENWKTLDTLRAKIVENLLSDIDLQARRAEFDKEMEGKRRDALSALEAKKTELTEEVGKLAVKNSILERDRVRLTTSIDALGEEKTTLEKEVAQLRAQYEESRLASKRFEDEIRERIKKEFGLDEPSQKSSRRADKAPETLEEAIRRMADASTALQRSQLLAEMKGEKDALTLREKELLDREEALAEKERKSAENEANPSEEPESFKEHRKLVELVANLTTLTYNLEEAAKSLSTHGPDGNDSWKKLITHTESNHHPKRGWAARLMYKIGALTTLYADPDLLAAEKELFHGLSTDIAQILGAVQPLSADFHELGLTGMHVKDALKEFKEVHDTSTKSIKKKLADFTTWLSEHKENESKRVRRDLRHQFTMIWDDINRKLAELSETQEKLAKVQLDLVVARQEYQELLQEKAGVETIVQAAKDEATQIRASAQSEAEKAKEQGYRDGLNQGKAEIRETSASLLNAQTKKRAKLVILNKTIEKIDDNIVFPIEITLSDISGLYASAAASFFSNPLNCPDVHIWATYSDKMQNIDHSASADLMEHFYDINRLLRHDGSTREPARKPYAIKLTCLGTQKNLIQFIATPFKDWAHFVGQKCQESKFFFNTPSFTTLSIPGTDVSFTYSGLDYLKTLDVDPLIKCIQSVSPSDLFLLNKEKTRYLVLSSDGRDLPGAKRKTSTKANGGLSQSNDGLSQEDLNKISGMLDRILQSMENSAGTADRMVGDLSSTNKRTLG